MEFVPGVLIFLATEDPMNLSWQAFIIINLVGILGVSFWLGSCAEKLKRVEKDSQDLNNRLSKADEDHKAELQRMRSAYHNLGGFLLALHPGFKPVDVDKPR